MRRLHGSFQGNSRLMGPPDPLGASIVVVALAIDDVQQARTRISGSVLLTPCASSQLLSDLTGASLSLKFENLQVTGSFKERGACNKLSALSADERAPGVITASAGNHGQAVALHASRLGISSTVVMPEATPLVKVTSTRRLGATVVLHGSNYDEAAERAAELQATHGYTYIHPFDDPWVIAGQGTIALELLTQVAGLEAVVVPIGGGGLIAGIALALKESRPEIEVFGVESRTFPGMKLALEGDIQAPVPGGKTIADGIAVRRVGALAVDIVRRYVDDIALVDEEEIAEAILLLLEREKTVVEGAGAVGVAAALHNQLPLRGKRVALILSGGNIDVNLVSRVIERGLVKTGRLARLLVTAPDVAGVLSGLTALVAKTRANILEINHDRAFSGVELGETLIELVLETHGDEHIELVCESLAKAGYRFERR
jgi:threonine dehydratase